MYTYYILYYGSNLTDIFPPATGSLPRLEPRRTWLALVHFSFVRFSQQETEFTIYFSPPNSVGTLRGSYGSRKAAGAQVLRSLKRAGVRG